MSTAGQYFRPPVRDVGFLPLNQYLENSGLAGDLDTPRRPRPRRVGGPCRLGRRPGLHVPRRPLAAEPRPHPPRRLDRPRRGRPVRPVEEARRHLRRPPRRPPDDPHLPQGPLLPRPCPGVDLHPAPTAGRDHLTWPDFHRTAACGSRRTGPHPPSHWTAADAPPHPRHAMELLESRADHLVTLLLQRGVNLIDADDRLHLTDDLTVSQTLAFYARLVCGPRRIAAESAAGGNPRLYANDLVAGNT